MDDLFDLTGKKAIVTGAAQGLGKAMAQGLNRYGCEIVVLDLNKEIDRSAEDMAGQDAPIHGVVCDLSDEEDLKRGFDRALELLGGRLHILVNNAGVNLRKSLAECTADEWDFVFKVNSKAPFLLTQMAAAVMKPQKYGKIINIASLLAFVGAFNNASYAASKGSVLLQTRSFSNELASHGICVNAIAPGYFKTDLNSPEKMKVLGEEFLTSINLRIPAGHWGEPEDLQGAAVFLASRASDYVTGLCINVDGGFLAR